MIARYKQYDLVDDNEDYDIGAAAGVEKPSLYRPHSPTYRPSHDADTSSSSSRTSSYGSGDAMLGIRAPTAPKTILRGSRARPERSFYRIPNRIMRWLCIALMSTVLVFILSLVRMGMTSTEYLEAYRRERGPAPPPWQGFGFLERYYGGLRTLVPVAENEAEYPNDEGRVGMNVSSAIGPTPTGKDERFEAQNGQELNLMRECFLDAAETIKVPRLHQFAGVPLGFPEAIIGSAEALGLPNETCHDRYGKLGPYGYGYSTKRGGVGAGLEGEKEGSKSVWREQPQVDFSSIQWSDAQSRCLARNRQLYGEQKPEIKEVYGDLLPRGEDNKSANSTKSKENDNASKEIATSPLHRTAIVVRTWTGFDYTPESILFLRSLVSELALASGGAYTVHFLIHVKDDNLPIWADRETYAATLNASLPAEFHGMGTLWSERQMGLIYGGLGETFYESLPVHGVYRSVFMPLQHFAQRHPEYEYLWNMEMDVRYTGHWGQLLDRLRAWAREQPRKGLWERAARFYVPSVHGSWDDFVHMVRVQSEMPPAGAPAARSKWAAYVHPDGEVEADPSADTQPVWGPQNPPDAPPFDTDPVPPTTYARDKYAWGVGEEADLIALNPLFDPAGSDWRLAADVTGYNSSLPPPPRRAAVVTTGRLSRRLLNAMHRETAHRRHAMFSEAWPASVALHHGLKAVAVPQPIFVDRAWPPAYLERIFNAGTDSRDRRARRALVFGEGQMHNLKGVSWYYNSGFAPNLWRRWLGFRIDGGGGEEWEVAEEGRMCLPPMLLHPIKDVRLIIEGTRIEGEEDAQ